MNLQFLITRTLYETPDISQRELAKKFSVSLGKLNQVIQETCANKYLSRDKSSYVVTDLGIEFLNEHKVDGALILACGMGVRLAPLTYDTPKSFIKIKGEKMIERQIEQLHSAGIKDITIMVGYLKEKFDYLIDKYNVKLIYNDEYRNKNTLATFYHAINVLKNKNMYVCVSDVYIEENIYHMYECEPYYIGAFYENCKNEWRYITNKKNEIKGVEVGGQNDYCLVGPSFLTKDFLDAFIPFIEKYYNKPSTDNFYWEDVLVKNLSKLPTIYVYKLDENIIYEFDSIKDIQDFDSNIAEYGSGATYFVSKALGIKESDITDIVCVKEGMTNKSYVFTAFNEHFMARIPGEGTNKFIDRKNEYNVYKLLFGKNLTEEIISFDSNNGYKISRFLVNARTMDITKEEELKDTMALYRKFHSLNLKVDKSIDMIDMIDSYMSKINLEHIEIPYEDFDNVMLNVRKIEKFVISQKRPKRLCHGDPNPGNVLYTKDGLKLIDFEYAGMADPLSDISLFGTYVDFSIEKTWHLYELYRDSQDNKYDEVIPKDEKKAIKLIVAYMSLSGMYSALWAILREALSGADYGSYGMKMYRTCKECYKYMEKELM